MGRNNRAEKQGEDVCESSDGFVRMGCSRGKKKINHYEKPEANIPITMRSSSSPPQLINLRGASVFSSLCFVFETINPKN
jgi:hypothetical protein